jgi:predicted phosphodiesterase
VFKKKDKILIVGDLHLPYPNKKALRWALKQIKEHKPTTVIQIGDIYDFFYSSKFTKKFLGFTPKEELAQGRKMGLDFWKQVQTLAPKAACIQLLGNHDERPYKRILEKVPELEPMFCYKELFQFDNVTTVMDPKEELILKVNGKKVLFHHGYLTGVGRHMSYHDMNCVVGHTHKGGIAFKGCGSGSIWELNVGYLGDDTAGPLQYGPVRRKYWTLGIGLIDEHGPRFIPYG